MLFLFSIISAQEFLSTNFIGKPVKIVPLSCPSSNLGTVGDRVVLDTDESSLIEKVSENEYKIKAGEKYISQKEDNSVGTKDTSNNKTFLFNVKPKAGGYSIKSSVAHWVFGYQYCLTHDGCGLFAKLSFKRCTTDRKNQLFSITLLDKEDKKDEVIPSDIPKLEESEKHDEADLTEYSEDNNGNSFRNLNNGEHKNLLESSDMFEENSDMLNQFPKNNELPSNMEHEYATRDHHENGICSLERQVICYPRMRKNPKRIKVRPENPPIKRYINNYPVIPVQGQYLNIDSPFFSAYANNYGNSYLSAYQSQIQNASQLYNTHYQQTQPVAANIPQYQEPIQPISYPSYYQPKVTHYIQPQAVNTQQAVYPVAQTYHPHTILHYYPYEHHANTVQTHPYNYQQPFFTKLPQNVPATKIIKKSSNIPKITQHYSESINGLSTVKRKPTMSNGMLTEEKLSFE